MIFRFYLTVGSTVTEVFPLNFLESSLVDSQESGQIFYRRKFNGSLTFVNNNGDDDFDYFFIGDDYVHIDDAWDGAVCNIDLTEDVCKPEPADVDRVLKIVGYQSYSMHFGTLVHVSS